MFSKKGKTILAFICVLCLVVATTGGVLSAKLLANLYLGEGITLASLDEQTSGVGIVNILLLGVDEGGMRSDTIMLVSMNGRTKDINIISIPRDTRIPMGRGYQKINAAIGVGMSEVKRGNLQEPEELSVQKVKLVTGLPIHYFMSVNFDGFKEIIDALGGVDFNIPFHMKYDDPVQNLHIDLKPGMQHLDGKAAHDFMRFRQGNPGYKGYVTGDLGRIEAQQAFIKELISQKLQPKYLLRAKDLFDVVCDNVRTNYTAKDLLSHLGTISKISSENVTMHQLPGYPQTINGISYYICDTAKMTKLAEDFFSPRAKDNIEPKNK